MIKCNRAAITTTTKQTTKAHRKMLQVNKKFLPSDCNMQQEPKSFNCNWISVNVLASPFSLPSVSLFLSLSLSLFIYISVPLSSYFTLSLLAASLHNNNNATTMQQQLEIVGSKCCCHKMPLATEADAGCWSC